MMSPIILDGPDCSGRSTLAAELEALGYYVMHSKRERSKNLPELFEDQLIQVSGPYVFDQFHLQEYVTGPVLRGGSRLTSEQVRNLNERIAIAGGQVVICLPPYEALLDAWVDNKNPDNVKQAGDLRAIYQGFVGLLEQRGNQYLRFDYIRYSVRSFARALKELEAK